TQPPPSAANAKAPASARPTELSPNAEREHASLALFAGVDMALPGDALLFPGGRLGLQYRHAALEFGVEIGTTLAETSKRDELSLSLRQSELRAELLARFGLAERLALSLGAGAGARLLSRSTAHTGSDQMATPARGSWSALLGPVAQLHWQFAHNVGLALWMGLDFTPRPTRFSFRIDDGSQHRLGQLAVAAPWLALALSVDIWK
ncbi:MAG TPA: hypothetical protein VGI70_17280, partial [Polyangiales bacterium]